MSGLTILFDTSSGTDLTYEVDGTVIGANSTIRFTEDPNFTGTDVFVGQIDFLDGQNGGAALLCTNNCTTADDVIDVVAFNAGMPPPALPDGVTFTNPLNVGVPDTLLRRQNTVGSNPSFLGTDWVTLPYY